MWSVCVSHFDRVLTIASQLFGFHLREQDHVANAFLAEQHHAQAVDPDANAAGGGHPVFERDEEIFVQLLPLAAGLMFERFALLKRIVLLGAAGRELQTVDAAINDHNIRLLVGLD